MNAVEPRIVFKGIAACHGVAVGAAKVVSRTGKKVVRRRLADDAVEREVERLRRAIEASRLEIEEARAGLTSKDSTDWGLILDAHLLMHRDELVVDATIEAIQRDRVNAEWALRRTVDGLRERLSLAGSGYFQERVQDLEHVAGHILRWLGDERFTLPELTGPRILVADDLSPADAARLVGYPVLALVTEAGSATSHTAVLARALGIPAVVGIDGIGGRVADGDTVIVDALSGEVVLDAPIEECERALERGRRHRSFTERLRKKPLVPATTSDGEGVELLANLELPTEVELLLDAGAEGVGLYRTEFLFLDRRRAPDEEEQYRTYANLVAAAAPRPVTFRTCDLGADKLPASLRLPRSQNPSLGLRALRLSLVRPDLFRTQVRAVLRASTSGPVRLMFPLVTSVDEMKRARKMVDEERAQLLAAGVPLAAVPIGAMIEVPSAAVLANTLARECEFFSVGTNDLVQYTLAADRGNPAVAHLGRSLDPSVLRLLAGVVAAAGQTTPLTMCGDMASDPVTLPVVLGLGFRSLSVAPSSLPLVREVVSRVSLADAAPLAEKALDLDGPSDVRALVFDTFGHTLAPLWEEHGVRF